MSETPGNEPKVRIQRDFPNQQFHEYLLRQYKLAVEMADRHSARRQETNRFFLTASVILLGLTSFFAKPLANAAAAGPPGVNLLGLVAFGIAGVVVSFLWMRLINSYSQLNRAKFMVINDLEKELPANVFEAEWQLLDFGIMRTYVTMTASERFLPISFGVLHLLIAVLAIVAPGLAGGAGIRDALGTIGQLFNLIDFL